MISHKFEYPIGEKVEDILSWLEEDMKSIESFDNGKIRVTYHSKRIGSTIEVIHKIHTDNDPSEQGQSFSFSVKRITDTRSLITGRYQTDNTDIEKLYYTYLARLGEVFDTTWKTAAEEKLDAINTEIIQAQGWHWGFTEWKDDQSTGRRSRVFGHIKNESEQNLQALGAGKAKSEKPELHPQTYVSNQNNAGLKPEKLSAKRKASKLRKKRRNKVPTLPKRIQNAYKWVLAWELLKPKIEDDPTLRMDIDELIQFLKSNNLAMKKDTIRKIIACGRANKIPPRKEFEMKNSL